MNRKHDRIEAIAGAIALGEATQEQRREYRAHIANCAQCLRTLGGEREIERVAEIVGAARDSEIWQPDLRAAMRKRFETRGGSMRYGIPLLALGLAVAAIVHVASTGGLAHLIPAPGKPMVIDAGATQVVVERVQPVALVQPPETRRLIVMHNVVQIARAPVAPPVIVTTRAHRNPRQIAAVTVLGGRARDRSSRDHSIPVWRRNDPQWRTVATATTTSLFETAPQSFTHSAESLQIAAPPVVREASPLGGETAIDPQPPMIAYDEGAQGTTAFEVLIDSRGNPTRCIITKAAGYAILDHSVCKAAMHVRYAPKTIDGRAVAGVYHDAFTFRMSENAASVIANPSR